MDWRELFSSFSTLVSSGFFGVGLKNEVILDLEDMLSSSSEIISNLNLSFHNLIYQARIVEFVFNFIKKANYMK